MKYIDYLTLSKNNSSNPTDPYKMWQLQHERMIDEYTRKQENDQLIEKIADRVMQKFFKSNEFKQLINAIEQLNRNIKLMNGGRK